VGETLGLEIYDTETSEWTRFQSIQRFRHGSWQVENFIYIYGGFELDSPNIPTNTITKINLTRTLQSDDRLLQKMANFIRPTQFHPQMLEGNHSPGQTGVGNNNIPPLHGSPMSNASTQPSPSNSNPHSPTLYNQNKP
jgi:hypothetical protein